MQGRFRRREHAGPIDVQQVDRPAGHAEPHGVAAGHVEMQRSVLKTRLARHSLQFRHVRHVANGHAAIVQEANQTIDLKLGHLVAGRAQGEFRTDVDFAVAQIGDRPLPAARSELQGPVVTQATDGNLADIDASGERLPLGILHADAAYRNRGRAKIELDLVDLGSMRCGVDQDPGSDCTHRMRRRQHTWKSDIAVATLDVDFDGLDLAAAARLDPQPAGQRDVNAAQQFGIGGQAGEHRGLQPFEIGLDENPASVTRVEA